MKFKISGLDFKLLIKKSIIVIIILIIAFNLGGRYERNKQIKATMDNYLNILFSELSWSAFKLASVDEWYSDTDENGVPHEYTFFIESINKAISLNENVGMYMGRYNYSNIFFELRQSFWLIENILASGLNNYKGLLADGKISDKEKIFLNNLREELEDINKKLLNDEGTTVNSDISIKELNEIFKEFTNKYFNFMVGDFDLE